MRTWILLIRGINVGGKNILPMSELVHDLDSLNLRHVKTYIQSGNAVFQSSSRSPTALGKKISAQLEARHGFRPYVLVLPADELRSAIERNPFPEAEAEPKTLHLLFLEASPVTPGTEALASARSPTERFKIDGRILYLHAPEGIGRSKLAAQAERHLGVRATGRNWRTVTKISELADTW